MALATAAGTIAAPAARGQERRSLRVGYLTGGRLAPRWFASFREEMAELGYVEGRNLALELRAADGRFDELPRLAAELLAARPDVLLVQTTPAGLAAKAATLTVPIVLVAVGDPIGVGLVPNLARPGGNITGITNSVVELTAKRLELAKELVPDADRVALIVNADDAIAPAQLRDAQSTAEALGVTLGPVLDVRSEADLAPAFARAAASGARAGLRLVDPTAQSMRAETARLALLHRLPLVYAFREDAEAGGLAAYGTSQGDLFRRAASFVHRIVVGAAPGDLPVEQPTRFELVLNLRTARAMGLVLPATLLARADEVIE